MTRPTRETVFAALFAQAQKAAGFTTFSRRLKSVTDTPAEDMPALYQVQVPEKRIYKPDAPPVNDWNAFWVIQGHEDDPTAAPSSALNPLLEAAAATLNPDAGDSVYTLGGLVTYCAIEGTIDIVEGVLGDRFVAVLPIRIILPGF